MKRIAGALLVVTFLFSVPLFLKADAASDGNPWERVWEAIENLQQQVDTIALTPGPEGPQGPQGEPGPTGMPGPSGVPGTAVFPAIYTRSATATIPAFGTETPATVLKAHCDSGDKVVSGGYWLNPGGVEVITNARSFVVIEEAWQVAAQNLIGGEKTLQVFVYCADVTP